jgi:hypothetical protein
MWRFLRTGKVPHQGHGLEYEAPENAPAVSAPTSEAAR